jgi:hypothetical protein
MKKIIRHSLLLVSWLIIQPAIGQQLKIKVYNKTGFDLDSVKIFSTQLLGLKNGDSVWIRGCKELIIANQLPLKNPSGLIFGKKQFPVLSKCGTKSRKIESGFFYFDIILHERADGYQLRWREHN